MSIAIANKLLSEKKFKEALEHLNLLATTYKNTLLERTIKYNTRYCERKLIRQLYLKDTCYNKIIPDNNNESAKHISIKNRKKKWERNHPVLLLISKSESNDDRALLKLIHCLIPNSTLGEFRNGCVVNDYHKKEIPFSTMKKFTKIVSFNKRIQINIKFSQHYIIQKLKASSSYDKTSQTNKNNTQNYYRLLLENGNQTSSLLNFEIDTLNSVSEELYLLIRRICAIISFRKETYPETPIENVQISQVIGILFHNLETGGLYRDAVIINKIYNSLGIIPNAFMYKNWRDLNKKKNIEGVHHSPNLHRFKAVFFESWENFIASTDTLIVPELFLPSLFNQLLKLDKKIVLFPNIESTIEPETLDIDESYKLLRELTNKKNFLLVAKNIATKRFYESKGLSCDYTPFSIDWAFKKRTSPKNNKSLKFLCNVGNVGMDDRKNVVAVLTAFQIAQKKYPKIELIIKSTINIKDRYKLSDKELINTTLINSKYTDKDLINLYLQSDCIIYASKYDGLGLGVLEAQALDMPIIISDIEPFRELLCENDKAFFVKGSINGHWRNVPVFDINIKDLARNIIEFVEVGYKIENNSKLLSYINLRNAIFTNDLKRIVFGDKLGEKFFCDASIAHFPERRELFLDILPNIITQFQRINIGLNEYDSVKGYFSILENSHNINIFLPDRDYKAITKFIVSTSFNADYCFTLDDDIFLPPDYVKKRIIKMEQYQNNVLISACGKRFNNYPKSRSDTLTNLRFREIRNCDLAVDNLGTGLMSWHVSYFSPTDFIEFIVSKELTDFAQVSVDDALSAYIFETGTCAVVESLDDESRFILHEGMKLGLHEIKIKDKNLDNNISAKMLKYPFHDNRNLIFNKLNY